MFSTAKSGTEALAKASVLLPAMLGADGPRNYLVLFQNNAEWRSLGGITGAMVLISTDGGAMQLADAPTPAATSRRVDASVCRSRIRGRRRSTGSGRASGCRTSRRCPTSRCRAPLAREMWALQARRAGGRRDRDRPGRAVVPACARPDRSHCRAATCSPPTTPCAAAERGLPALSRSGGSRRSSSRMRLPRSSRALTSGAADPAKLLEALARAGDERRLLLWSAHPEEQELLADTTLAGALPVTDSTDDALRRLPQRRHRLEDGLLPDGRHVGRMGLVRGRCGRSRRRASRR